MRLGRNVVPSACPNRIGTSSSSDVTRSETGPSARLARSRYPDAPGATGRVTGRPCPVDQLPTRSIRANTARPSEQRSQINVPASSPGPLSIQPSWRRASPTNPRSPLARLRQLNDFLIHHAKPIRSLVAIDHCDEPVSALTWELYCRVHGENGSSVSSFTCTRGPANLK